MPNWTTLSTPTQGRVIITYDGGKKTTEATQEISEATQKKFVQMLGEAYGCVANQSQLEAAINSEDTEISLCRDIALTNKISIDRNMKIIGSGHSVTLNTSNWS